MSEIVTDTKTKSAFNHKVIMTANEMERDAYARSAEALGIADRVEFRVSDAPKFGSWSK